MKTSRSFILHGLLTGLLMGSGQAQDVVYFANDGSSVSNTRLTDAVNDKLILTVLRDGTPRDVTFTRSRIALIFTKAGNYLLPAELDSDPAQARQQIQTFLTDPPRRVDSDFLIRTSPLTVIAAQMAYESDGVVNYVTSGGNTASISTRNLTAILFRDGRHKLLAPVATAAPLLNQIRAQLTNPAAASDTASWSVAASSIPSVADPDSPTDTAGVASPAGTSSGIAPPASTTSDDKLPLADERTEYRNRALHLIDELRSYLNIITDKRTSNSERSQAIDLAERFFLPESTVEVTSIRRVGLRRYSVRQYLTRLQATPHPSVRISQAQTQLVRDPVENPDGTYACTTEGQQFFLATDLTEKAIYTDPEIKKVRIGPEQYYRLRQEQRNGKWRVMLGAIRVEAN